MIHINLLPDELRPIKRTPLPYIVCAAIAGFTLFAMFVTFIANTHDIATQKRQLAENQEKLDKLQPIVDEYNALTAKKEQLATQVKTIDEIARDRIIWSRQLYNLTRLALDNLWYHSIEVSMKPFEETHTVWDPNTKENVKKKVRVDKLVLGITGFIVPGPDGQSTLSPFTIATDNDPEFSNLFLLDLVEFEDTEFKDMSVRAFELDYIITPGGSDQ